MDPVTLQFDPVTVVLLVLYVWRSSALERRVRSELEERLTPEPLLLRAMERVLQQAASSPHPNPNRAEHQTPTLTQD